MAQQVKLTKPEERGHGHMEKKGEPVAHSSIAPAVDVYESEEEFLLVADLPGIRREDLRIDIENEQLLIEGHCEKAGERRGRELACEFRPLDYKRSFALPEGIDASRITAQLASGILMMHLPKQARERPHRVEVKAVP